MAQRHEIDLALLATDLRRHLAQVRYRGARKVVMVEGVPSGALISMRDLARIEALDAQSAAAETQRRSGR
ncbi:hypothetical protein DI396_06515 [Litorivita pollutaquae]|uniref:Antitoxin Phd_YefM, type II toxin-antitoxin system n=1 Tax=Litorivita pollutaquae TaxID=2200892 RepID=A0A2V4NFB9_9RHOB|nr:hypothetical protein [Litorivita pollutaquae]PYC48610.1 hypothetical protein DI396_06515 [Litorivita pollutaquae]